MGHCCGTGVFEQFPAALKLLWLKDASVADLAGN